MVLDGPGKSSPIFLRATYASSPNEPPSRASGVYERMDSPDVSNPPPFLRLSGFLFGPSPHLAFFPLCVPSPRWIFFFSPLGFTSRIFTAF